MSKEEATIKLFKAVVEDKFSNLLVKDSDLLLNALKKGILINPHALDGRTEEQRKNIAKLAVEEYGVNVEKVNSTFYKNFSDVENRSELQLRLEQLAHYMSTYGRGFDNDDNEIYEPEFLKEVSVDVNSELVYIDAITKEELAGKVKNMLTGGIALSKETQDLLFVIIKGYKLEINYVDQINNREFMCRMCNELGLLPKSFDEFTRYLIYLATGSTLLIKSRQVINQLGHLNSEWDHTNRYKPLEKAFEQYVNTLGIEQVAKNITRYRKVYLVLRKHFTDKTLINRATHLSKKMYTPRKQSPLEHVMDTYVDIRDVDRAIVKAPIYKLVKLYNALLRAESSQKARYFKIRTGKSFLKVTDRQDAFSEMKRNRNYQLRGMILDELKHRYDDWSNKAFYIPEGINYAVPTTAKDFIGGLPYMTTYDFEGKDVSLGIAWDEPRTDLDLHMMSLNGSHYGWNGSYRGDVIYSGDMTRLNRYGYAAEFYKIKAKSITDPMVVTINDFRSPDKVKFDVFVTGANVSKSSEQGVATQIGEKSVLFHDEVSPDDASKTLMLVIPTEKGFKIAFTGDSYGNQYVPNIDNSTQLLIDILKKQVDNTFTLNDLIELLGGTVISTKKDLQELKDKIVESSNVDKTFTNRAYVSIDVKVPEIIDLSPSKVTQSTFIDLLKGSEGVN